MNSLLDVGYHRRPHEHRGTVGIDAQDMDCRGSTSTRREAERRLRSNEILVLEGVGWNLPLHLAQSTFENVHEGT